MSNILKAEYVTRLLFIIVLFLTTSCSNDNTIHFYSLDRSNSLTVISRGNDRYVTPGITKGIPKSNYAKFDISSVPDYDHGIWICWCDNNKWDLTINHANLIETDLDTSMYQLYTSLPTDSLGIPTEIKYRQENCAVFSYYLMRLSPNNGAIVEIN